MRVRLAVDTDLDEIARCLVLEGWKRGRHVSADREKAGIQDLMADPHKGMYLIAEDADGVAGCMCVAREDDSFQERWSYVCPEFSRGRVLQLMRDYVSSVRRY